MSVHSVDSSGKGSGKTKKTAPSAPVANASGITRVVRNPAVAPGATVSPARVLTQVTPLPKASAPAQPTASAPTTGDNADDSAPAPATSADFGKTILQTFGIAPEAPTLQTRIQYVALANRLMASSPSASAPVAAHDAPGTADAGRHTSGARAGSVPTAATRRVDVSA